MISHSKDALEVSFTIPLYVKTIGVSAFKGCVRLMSINFPFSTEKISSNAFYGCGLNYVSIPDGVREIEGNPFGMCETLQSVEVSDNVPYFTSVDGVLFSKVMDTLVCYPCSKQGNYAVPSTVKRIKHLLGALDWIA